LHAGADGDAARTLATALRATLLITLPMLAGGTLAAEALAGLNGPAFVAAAPALALLLLAGCLQHLGWQCSHALLAMRRDTAYAHSLGWPAWLQFTNLALLPLLLPPDPALGATLAAAGAAVAQGVYAVTCLGDAAVVARARRSLEQPAAALPADRGRDRRPVVPGSRPLRLPLQLGAGAAAFGYGLWRLELRGRWARLGDGLATASGYGA
jgi:O-antigen/teichoic acid export membrane protein